MEFKGNLIVVIILRGYVGISVGECEYLFIDRSLGEDWVDRSGLLERRRLL